MTFTIDKILYIEIPVGFVIKTRRGWVSQPSLRLGWETQPLRYNVKLLAEISPQVIETEEDYDQILQHLMEVTGTCEGDLVGVIGSSNVVSEILNNKRSISKTQAKALGDYFQVSINLFI